MENDLLTEKIISCCYEVHNELGPGFHEKVYQRALRIALRNRNIRFDEEKSYKINFRTSKVGTLRLDLLIESKIIAELKAIIGIMPKIFEQQLIAYLKITNLTVGLLINFGNKSCQIRRLLNNHCNHLNNHRNHLNNHRNHIKTC